MLARLAADRLEVAVDEAPALDDQLPVDDDVACARRRAALERYHVALAE